MTGSKGQSLCSYIEQQLTIEKEIEQPEQIDFIRSILQRNIENGRAQKVLYNSDCDLDDYINQVTESVSRWRTYLYKLQVESSEDAWQELLPKLRRWAYAFFLRWGAFLEQERSEQAHHASIDGAIEILTSDFPFDVDFEPWARALQRNVCCRLVRESIKNTNGTGIKLLELDALDNHFQQLPDPELTPLDIKIGLQELRQELLTSVEQLATNQKSFLKYYYFDGFSYPEIMCELNKSRSALYSLHHNALKNLRSIISIDHADRPSLREVY